MYVEYAKSNAHVVLVFRMFALVYNYYQYYFLDNAASYGFQNYIRGPV